MDQKTGKSDSERARELERQQLEASEEGKRRAAEARERIDKLARDFLEEPGEPNTGVHELAKLMGQDKPGTLPTLPVPEAPEEPVTLRPAELVREQTKPRQERALVVDDEPDTAEIIADQLRKHGYAVRVCHDGLDALAMVLRQPPEPDVILLDIGLPTIPGPGVAAALKYTKARDIPILWISNGSPDDLPQWAKEDFVFIPKSPGTSLLERVEAAVRAVAVRIGERRARGRTPF